MIRGVHTMFYSSQPEELRAFLRDKLGFQGVDVGDGWLIFDLPEADMGCHPLEEAGPPSGTPYISFYCDDLEETVAELQERGVEFADNISDLVHKFLNTLTYYIRLIWHCGNLKGVPQCLDTARIRSFYRQVRKENYWLVPENIRYRIFRYSEPR